ncbi:hypothetical protein [Chishuiella sp.]|uniref:hypothetical protein n=1 Tax=Chishuiella sp. TaxID=1969467 RepID=UPI0028AA1418|nr:hypothetical protein [Chishuiella sp.]
MKNYYIDTVNVIINGVEQELVTITGMGDYNINIIKSKAIEIVKPRYPNSILAAVILEHKEVTLEEYKAITGSNPPWI